MQGLMVVGFIVDEILRVGFKVGTSRRSHTQGLMVVGFIVDEILRVGLKNDSHWSMKYR